MAVAGGATSAFLCQVVDGELVFKLRTTLRSQCVGPEAALTTLATGQQALVASSDMVKLRALLGVRDLAVESGFGEG